MSKVRRRIEIEKMIPRCRKLKWEKRDKKVYSSRK
jgi:hypothetical protein